jgi:hypothetical protein
VRLHFAQFLALVTSLLLLLLTVIFALLQNLCRRLSPGGRTPPMRGGSPST